MTSQVRPRGVEAAARRNSRMRGTAMIFVTVAIVSCLAFSVLTLDVGMILMTKIQLQNAADAAALAGASALLSNNQEEARRRAIAAAAQNVAWQDGLQPVAIEEVDVTFPEPSRCRVTTHRTRATCDALRTFFIGVLVPESDRRAEVSAVAEAEYFDVCGTSCIKPWSVPDRWDDLNRNGEYDYGEPFTDRDGDGVRDPNEPYDDTNKNHQYDAPEPYDPVATGYEAPADMGMRMTLKVGDPNSAIVPSFFYAVDLPPMGSAEGSPETGAATYRDYIENCANYTVEIGDRLQVEPGNMVGPTRQGTESLIARDPGAYWDSSTQSVQGSAFGSSPRVVKIAFFDPRFTPKSGRNYVVVVKLTAFFIEDVGSQGRVSGVFMGAMTQGDPCAAGEPSFLASLRLVH